jgi:DNA-binding transcriptional MerR regulator
MAQGRDFMTIGELVESLQPAHPDLTISKVRFLEDEGLITPERTAGGYRKFSGQEAARVDLVLREKLKDLDKGRVPDDLRSMVTRPEAVSLPFDEVETVPLDQIQSTMGLPVTFINELAGFGLVRIVKGENGDELKRADIEIAHSCWDLRRFGVEPRHLRMYENLADREGALFSQILMPQMRHRTPETRQKLVETISEITKCADDLKRHLLKRAIADAFEDVI